MTEPRIAAQFFPGRPRLVNAERAEHWQIHRRATRTAREAAGFLWAKEARKGRMSLVKVDVWLTYAHRPLSDTGSCLPEVKAIIDGAVDATLLPHDGPEVVAYLGFHRPKVDGDLGDGLFITIEELEEDSPWAT